MRTEPAFLPAMVELWGTFKQRREMADRFKVSIDVMIGQARRIGLPAFLDKEDIKAWRAAGSPLPWREPAKRIRPARDGTRRTVVPVPKNAWTEAEIAILTANASRPASEFAGLLPGRDIRAIQAKRQKMRVLGLITYTQPQRPPDDRVRDRKPRHRPRAKPKVVTTVDFGHPVAPTRVTETVVPTGYEVPRAGTRCCYPYGDAPPFLFCTAEFERGEGPWCPEHRKAVYQWVPDQEAA